MNIRVWYNIILVNFKIRKVLPKEAIRRITIKECGEKLLSLPDGIFFVLNDSGNIYGRETVIKKLIAVEKFLEKQGYRIGVFEIYRDELAQQRMREQEYEHLKKEYPCYTCAEIEKILTARISNLTDNAVGGHQTGGAIDLTLCTKEGALVDMGTGYLEFNEKTNTYCKHLSLSQKMNRKLLLGTMKKVGFVNYPNEWWHFSYGDKMWAAYKHKCAAIYGNAKCCTKEDYSSFNN